MVCVKVEQVGMCRVGKVKMWKGMRGMWSLRLGLHVPQEEPLSSFHERFLSVGQVGAHFCCIGDLRGRPKDVGST